MQLQCAFQSASSPLLEVLSWDTLMLSVWWSEFLVLELRTASWIILDTAEYRFFGCFPGSNPREGEASWIIRGSDLGC